LQESPLHSFLAAVEHMLLTHIFPPVASQTFLVDEPVQLFADVVSEQVFTAAAQVFVADEAVQELEEAAEQVLVSAVALHVLYP
jgi:hypothetical protein